MPESTEARARLRAGLLQDRAPTPRDAQDAEPLIEAALAQGLGGWLARRARSAGTWPEAPLERLVAIENSLLARGLRQLDQAGTLQARLLERGLRVLPLKGVALSERLYASPAERSMADIDLLALDSFPATGALLAEWGLLPGERADHAWVYGDPLTGLVVELHHVPVSCPGLFPLRGDDLWARRVAGPGLVPHLPSAADLLVLLALHAAFQHGLVLKLGQYLDFRRLLESEEVVPQQVHELAKGSRAGAALEVSLRVAGAMVGAPVAALLREKQAPVALERWLAGRLSQPLDFLAPSVPHLLRLRWHLAAGQRLRFLHRSLVRRPDGPGRLGLGRALRIARWLRTLVGSKVH